MSTGTRTALAAALTSAIVLAGIAASASHGSGKRSATTQVSGTVTLAAWKSSSVEDDLVRQVVKAFQKKYPKIKVSFTPYGGDYDATMLAKFSARKPPDVLAVNGHVFPVWVKQGVLQPVSPYIKKYHFSTKPFFARLLNGFKYRGQIYGFPKDWSPLGMFVNTDMLKKAGAKIPTTWAQLRSVAQKLKSSNAVPGGRPICLSADWARLFAFAYQNGYKGGIMRSATLTGAAVRGAANFYTSLFKDGLAGQPANLGAGWNGEGFQKGKCAITYEGNWLVPLMKEVPSVHYTIAQLPKGKTRGNLAFSAAYAIARDSKNKAAAWTLEAFLVGRAGMKKWTSLGLALPSRRDVKPVSGRGAFLKAASYSRVWQGGPKFNDVITVGNNELTAVLEGKESVSSMLSKTRAAAQKAGQ